MAYVELSKENWDDVIKAAANKAGSVAAVVNKCGGFTSNDDAPPGAVAEEAAAVEEVSPEAPVQAEEEPATAPVTEVPTDASGLTND